MAIAEGSLSASLQAFLQANLPSGGKANLARLNSEVEALEGLILRFRS